MKLYKNWEAYSGVWRNLGYTEGRSALRDSPDRWNWYWDEPRGRYVITAPNALAVYYQDDKTFVTTNASGEVIHAMGSWEGIYEAVRHFHTYHLTLKPLAKQHADLYNAYRKQPA